MHLNLKTKQLSFFIKQAAIYYVLLLGFCLQNMECYGFAEQALGLAPLGLQKTRVEQRTSYSSQRLLSIYLHPVWALEKNFSIDGSFSFLRIGNQQALNVRNQIQSQTALSYDSFFHGTLAANYGARNLGFHFGAYYGSYPTLSLHTLGGFLSILYLYGEDGAYSSEDHELPRFWLKGTYYTGRLRSPLAVAKGESAEQMNFFLEGFYPFSSQLLLGAGFRSFNHRNQKGIYALPLRLKIIADTQNLGITLPELPSYSLYSQAAWQFTNVDTILSSYLATQIEETNRWAHSINLGWQHNFSKNWAISPHYELSVLTHRLHSGFLLSFLYLP